MTKRQRLQFYMRMYDYALEAKGFDEVLYPGEIEWRNAKERLKSGIFIEDATWNGLQGLMNEFGINIEPEIHP